jgi:hypothetical protein
MAESFDHLELFAAALQEAREAPAGPLPCAGELPAEVAQVVEVLRGCVGRERGMTSVAIAERVGILPGRSRMVRGSRVRDLIRDHLLHLPWPVVGDPSSGYYIPATMEEVRRYVADLLGRAEADLDRLRVYASMLQRTEWHAAAPRADAIESLVRHLQALR